MAKVVRKRLDSLRALSVYLWIYKFTPSGKALIVAGVLSGALGSASVEIPIYQLFLALFFMGFLSLCVGLAYRPRLTIEGRLPDTISVGIEVESWVTITNRSWLPAYDVSCGFLELPEGFREPGELPVISRIGGGESVHAPVRLVAKRRGRHALPPLRAFSTFPFNLCRSGSCQLVVSPILVLPQYTPLGGIHIPIARRYQPGGLAFASQIGESAEYIGNREYRVGDPTRHIDFRAWARLSRPVVKEFQEEYYSRVALVLDTYPGSFSVNRYTSFLCYLLQRERRMCKKGMAALDGVVSVGASVAEALCKNDYVIDVVAAGPRLHVFRSGRRTTPFESVLEILACVDRCPEDPISIITPVLVEELQTLSTVVCLLLDWDEPRMRLARAAVESGCSLKLIIVRDGETTLPLRADEPWSEGMAQIRPKDIAGADLDIL